MTSGKKKTPFESFLCSLVRDESSVDEDSSDRPKYIIDLDDVILKYDKWIQHLPRVRPFYAFKCNESNQVIRSLAKLGAGFDCASSYEVRKVLETGDVKSGSDDIIFANPCKTRSMIRYAKEKNIQLMTFDSEFELQKIRDVYPDAKLLIRLRVNDDDSKYKLGAKFGVEDDQEIRDLLKMSLELKLCIVGVAFHVGSDCQNDKAYADALRRAKEVFKWSTEIGLPDFSYLDIGGGFPGDIDWTDPSNLFYRMAYSIDVALNSLFPSEEYPNLKIISEPGRYFVSSAFCLLTKIVGKKDVLKTTCPSLNGTNGHSDVTNGRSHDELKMYYLNDGLFGSFLIKFWEPELVKNLKPFFGENQEVEMKNRKLYDSIVWGPTCDSSDVILKDFQMVDMRIGEHLMICNYGAYTVPLTTPFNGMEKPEFLYFISPENNKRLDLF